MNVKNLRTEIDRIDNKILKLLKYRFQKVADIGRIKHESKTNPIDMRRWESLMDEKIMIAKELNISKKLVERIWNLIHEESLRIEKNNK